MKTLRGITWNHTRGLLPLQAAAQIYSEHHPDVQIIWEKRSLQAFADAPLETMVKKYDMLVIDHPHVGEAAHSREILPLNDYVEADFLENQASNSVGKSYESYIFDEKTWAFPIDAATPVSVYRPDLLKKSGYALPQTWEEVIDLAKAGFVVMPNIPINSLMDFYMFSMACGCELFNNGRAVDREAGQAALQELKKITELVPWWCAKADPIAVHNYLARSEKEFYCPSAYGYSAYSLKGYGKHLLKGDRPVKYGNNYMSSTLGGTGLAVSSHSEHRELAFDYALEVAGESFQKTVYVSSGGQPGHRKAWSGEYANDITSNYFMDTLPALDGAYLRPRYKGYLDFQDKAGQLIYDFRYNGKNAGEVLDEVEKYYGSKFAKQGGDL